MAVRLTAYAFVGLALRTASLLDRKSLFHDKYFFVFFLPYQLKSGEYSGRTCADYYDIVIFGIQFDSKLLFVNTSIDLYTRIYTYMHKTCVRTVSNGTKFMQARFISMTVKYHSTQKKTGSAYRYSTETKQRTAIDKILPVFHFKP